jgi:hypothetical protein
VLGVGSALAADLDVPVLAVRVLRDRQLVIAAWRDGHQVARYVSDPSFDHEERSQLLTDPVGVESAIALAETCGRSNVAAELAALLDRGLDPESFIESERLAAVLALLQLPSWLVSVAALPRHLPTGPRRADFARLGAGATGPAGPVARWGSEWVRRWRRQPPVVPNPPRRRVDVDPWLL